MTRYAFDEARRTLVRTYETPVGDLASDVTQLDDDLVDQGNQIAKALASLSLAFWRSFTHPGSSADDDCSPNTEGWRREGEREGFEDAIKALTDPNLPGPDGTLMMPYGATEAAGHVLGRIIAACNSESLTASITAEVRAEAHAVERAEAGMLRGRGEQATAMSRPVVSPLQANAAHEVLSNDPFSPPSAFRNLEPVSAAAAAAHWLWTAAQITSKASGYRATRVLAEADNIEPLPWETPSAILRDMEDGASAVEAVTSVIRAALAIADGEFETYLTVDSIPNVMRPGPDLLEDLLYGIHACLLIWQEADDGGDEGTPDEVDFDDDAYWDARDARRQAAFTKEVGRRATRTWAQ